MNQFQARRIEQLAQGSNLMNQIGDRAGICGLLRSRAARGRTSHQPLRQVGQLGLGLIDQPPGLRQLLGRGLRVARQIESGICHINGPTVHDEAQMPFGGVGASGYGRFGGKAGIDSFTELRWITIETQPGHFPN